MQENGSRKVQEKFGMFLPKVKQFSLQLKNTPNSQSYTTPFTNFEIQCTSSRKNNYSAHVLPPDAGHLAEQI